MRFAGFWAVKAPGVKPVCVMECAHGLSSDVCHIPVAMKGGLICFPRLQQFLWFASCCETGGVLCPIPVRGWTPAKSCLQNIFTLKSIPRYYKNSKSTAIVKYLRPGLSLVFANRFSLQGFVLADWGRSRKAFQGSSPDFFRKKNVNFFLAPQGSAFLMQITGHQR